MSIKNQAVFFDLPGIFIITEVDHGHEIMPTSPEQFKALVNERAIDEVKRLRKNGFLVIVTTNQPGLTNGQLRRGDFDRMVDHLHRVFEIDDVYVCPHGDDEHCPCRKPEPQMFKEAALKWHINLARSFIVSSKWQDARAASNLGCVSITLQSPQNGYAPGTISVPNLSAAIIEIFKYRLKWKEE